MKGFQRRRSCRTRSLRSERSLLDLSSRSVDRRRDLFSWPGDRSSRCLRSAERERWRRWCRLDRSLLSSRRLEDFLLLWYFATASATSSFFSSIRNSFIGSSSSWFRGGGQVQAAERVGPHRTLVQRCKKNPFAYCASIRRCAFLSCNVAGTVRPTASCSKGRPEPGRSPKPAAVSRAGHVFRIGGESP